MVASWVGTSQPNSWLSQKVLDLSPYTRLIADLPIDYTECYEYEQKRVYNVHCLEKNEMWYYIKKMR